MDIKCEFVWVINIKSLLKYFNGQYIIYFFDFYKNWKQYIVKYYVLDYVKEIAIWCLIYHINFYSTKSYNILYFV